MNFTILTLFPNMFESLNHSIIGRALDDNKIKVNLVDIRKYSENKHKKVDEKPFGGGPGMLLRADVVGKAIKDVKENIENKSEDNTRLIYLTPKGKTLTQEKVRELSSLENIILLCGHYEGIDQRIIDQYVDEEISVGDYVLSGGEIPAMLMVDCISRLKNEVINSDSVVEESFSNYLLEYPQYTAPREYEGMHVPEVLLSGDHEKIRKYRLKESIRETYNKRKDLIEKNIEKLTEEEKEFLKQIKNETNYKEK